MKTCQLALALVFLGIIVGWMKMSVLHWMNVLDDVDAMK